MPNKDTLFVVTDIETTLRKRIAFDVAWKTINKKGKEFGRGSYVIREAFKHDVPFFKEKLGHYFDDTFSGLIVPAGILDVRNEYNRQISELQALGHRVIGAAYNAAFDFKYLPESLSILTDGAETRWMTQKIELLDIWQAWGDTVPRIFRSRPTESGKFYSTSAESAYRWEFVKPDFEERHIAWHDCEIESEILVRALSRKKKMPIVKSPAEFVGSLYKRINTRLGVNGKDLLPGFVKPEPAMVGA